MTAQLGVAVFDRLSLIGQPGTAVNITFETLLSCEHQRRDRPAPPCPAAFSPTHVCFCLAAGRVLTTPILSINMRPSTPGEYRDGKPTIGANNRHSPRLTPTTLVCCPLLTTGDYCKICPDNTFSTDFNEPSCTPYDKEFAWHRSLGIVMLVIMLLVYAPSLVMLIVFRERVSSWVPSSRPLIV